MLAIRIRSDRRRAGLSAACVLSVVLAVAACSSAAPPNHSGAAAPQNLTISVGGNSIILGDLVLADAKGYFQKEGLDVKLEYLGVPAAQDAIAGDVDLSYSAPTQTFSAIAAGRPVQTIWSSTIVNTSLSVAVAQNSTAKTLMDLSGKSIASYPEGSASYGDAVYLSGLIVAKGGKPLKIEQFDDATAIETQIVSGRVAAGLGAGDFFAALIAQKKVRLLVQTQDFRTSPLFNFVNSGMFGLTSTISKKHVAVQRLINGMLMAAKFITSSSSAEIASVLKGASMGQYTSESTQDLVNAINADRWFLDKSDGCITEQAWTGTLALAKGFNLPLSGRSLDDPIFSIGQATDMSFLKTAGVTC
jgi:ABC-type nitrate/sulfonate/bicarbonate transport system substrate-binding protein